MTISRLLKRGLPGLAVMASVMLFSAHPLEAQIKDGTGGLEINAFYGMLNGLGDTEFENDPVPWRLDNDPYFGGRLGYVFDIGVGIEGFFGYVDSKIVGSAYDGSAYDGSAYDRSKSPGHGPGYRRADRGMCIVAPESRRSSGDD